MTSVLEPLVFKRPLRLYEVFFWTLCHLGLYFDFRGAKRNMLGIVIRTAVHLAFGAVFIAQWETHSVLSCQFYFLLPTAHRRTAFYGCPFVF